MKVAFYESNHMLYAEFAEDDFSNEYLLSLPEFKAENVIHTRIHDDTYILMGFEVGSPNDIVFEPAFSGGGNGGAVTIHRFGLDKDICRKVWAHLRSKGFQQVGVETNNG